ncbi:MAG: hypothetical protein MUO67_05960 [Anaerolineales bacterium]|nr:hypothetical protein [Anaerolineales bacterium]
MIELHLTIIRSNDPEKAPDPLLVLHGGPGGYALNMMDYWLSILDKTLLIPIFIVSLILVPLIWRL